MAGDERWSLYNSARSRREGELKPRVSIMADFASWQSYRKFSQSVTSRWRYTRDEECISFLDAVCSSLGTRIESISTETLLWRAQRECNWKPEFQDGEHVTDVPCPLELERMKPLQGQATEGRANPKGIPYLYVATHKETAIAETRPWIDAEVTVALLEVRQPLKIVNCASKDKNWPIIYFEEPSPAEKEAANWNAIDAAFSRPVTASDRLADYVPTQILAEEFRRRGFDGLAYHSSLGPGHNITIFDFNAAEVSALMVCRVCSLAITAKDITTLSRR